MKDYSQTAQGAITSKIIKILNQKGLSQASLCEVLEIDDSNVNKLLRNCSQLSYNSLAKIAQFFGMSVVELIAWPDRYVKAGSPEDEPIDAVLQIRLKDDKKDQVLKLVFGDNNIELLKQ